MGYYHKNYS